MNRLLRAVDENEQFYNVDNYAKNTPNDMVRTCWNNISQIEYVVDKLKNNKQTRQAAISIYDCKEHPKYEKDTPCTYAVQFTILHDRLDMCVVMRSNDLWYGFCNDQYCFSKLQELVSKETGLKMGTYYHFAHNLHIYSNKLGL